MKNEGVHQQNRLYVRGQLPKRTQNSINLLLGQCFIAMCSDIIINHAFWQARFNKFW